jgi:hypothetical protein
MITHLSVFTEYRGYLFSVAQRILGSRSDAEDLLQETFIRWQQTAACSNKIPKSIPGNCTQTSLSESPEVSSRSQGDLR